MGRDRALTEAWWMTRTMPGWLGVFMHELRITAKEEAALIELDDAFHVVDVEMSEWMKKTARDRRWGVFDCDSDEEIYQSLTGKIAEIHVEYEGMVNRDTTYQERREFLVINELEAKMKVRKSIRAGILHRARIARGEPENPNRITDWDIEAARKFPLEKLVPELNRHNRMPCRWHNGKGNNFLVKEGFGYCFVCNVSVDAIKWLIEINNYSFPDAVRFLARGII